MKYRLAIFDLDGTILDTLDDLTNSANHALSVMGMPLRTIDEIRSFVGNGIPNLMKLIVPYGTDEKTINEVHAEFTAHYKKHCADFTKPYEGIKELIEDLRYNGMMTAVVSNKADYAVKTLCEDYFKGLFDAAIGEQMPLYRKKPNPDLVYKVMKDLGVTADEAVYIGDSDVDIKTSKNAGIPCITVTWGFRDREFLLEQGAEIIAESMDELKGLF